MYKGKAKGIHFTIASYKFTAKATFATHAHFEHLATDDSTANLITDYTSQLYDYINYVPSYVRS